MRGVNLIPSRRIHARRRAARIRLWLSVVPAFATVVMGSYGWLRTVWNTDTLSLQTLIDDTQAQNAKLEESIARDKAQMSQQTIRLRANRAVGEQPDWGVLLFVLASHLGENVVLSNCTLEPIAAVEKAAARPERFRLTVSGLGKDQSIVSEFVLALDKMAEPRIFESVRLVESRRVPLAGKDAVQFQIQCTLAEAETARGAP